MCNARPSAPPARPAETDPTAGRWPTSAVRGDLDVELLQDGLQPLPRQCDGSREPRRQALDGRRVVLAGTGLQLAEQLRQIERTERRGARLHAMGVAGERRQLAAARVVLDLLGLRIELLEEHPNDSQQRTRPAEIVLQRVERGPIDAAAARRRR